ncbi:MAG: PepSY domain-containing protein [Vicinamibacterales bacterium]
MKRLLGLLIRVHRYTGVLFCLVFLAWFASGLVMVFHRMPEYSPAERLARLAPLEAERVTLTAADAVARAGLDELPQRMFLLTLGTRPVYRLLGRQGWVSVFADDGRVLEPLDGEAALGVAHHAFPEHAATAAVADLVTEPDQWTIGHPFALSGALHRIRLGDAGGTELYVETATGDIALKTTRASRLWGYAGPVLHWFYFRPLRVQGQIWYDLIVYGSLAGLAVCLLGLVIGVWRVSPRRRHAGGTSFSPYAGWMRWHHYAGLVFGVATCTFLLSGTLSMVPWEWSPGNGPEPAQVLAIRGARVDPARFGLSPADAVREFAAEFAPKEVEFRTFLGRPFYIAYAPVPVTALGTADAAAAPRHLLVRADGIDRQVGELFSPDELLEAAQAVMPDAAPVDAAWLTAFDAYYYGRGAERRLPVLRVRFDDADGTWLYLDAHDGNLVQREVQRTRVERWVYHGLHSLDVPWLYQTAWAWYAAIIGLSLGGLGLSLTAVVLAWRYLRTLVRPRRSAGQPLRPGP